MYNEKRNSIITSLVKSFARQKHLPELRARLKQNFPGDIYRQVIVYQICQRQLENVDFRRKGMSFFAGQYTSVYSP